MSKKRLSIVRAFVCVHCTPALDHPCPHLLRPLPRLKTQLQAVSWALEHECHYFYFFIFPVLDGR